MTKHYFRQAGSCTRCEEAFGGNAAAYMVREKVVWTVIGDMGLTQIETVPVCDACVTGPELENATDDAACAGCGQRLRLSAHWPKPVCSNRCEQRDRRKRRRARRPATRCSICEAFFVPKRNDAKFCSNACRQRAYRQSASAAKQVPEAQSPCE